MAAKPPKNDDERSPQETERIREATLKRLLNTPPKRHAEMLKERKARRQHKDMVAERKGKRPPGRGKE